MSTWGELLREAADDVEHVSYSDDPSAGQLRYLADLLDRVTSRVVSEVERAHWMGQDQGRGDGFRLQTAIAVLAKIHDGPPADKQSLYA